MRPCGAAPNALSRGIRDQYIHFFDTIDIGTSRHGHRVHPAHEPGRCLWRRSGCVREKSVDSNSADGTCAGFGIVFALGMNVITWVSRRYLHESSVWT